MAGWQDILAQGIQDTNNIIGSLVNNAWNQHNYEQDFNQRVNEFQANQIAQAQQFEYQKQQDMLNREQQQQQIDFNQNLANQQFNYQKSLQQQIFEREDNSIQRQIAGMRQAGLNPLSNSNSQANSTVVGSMGSGSSVSPVSSNAHISSIGSTGNSLPQIHFNPIDFLNQMSTRNLQNAEADKLKADSFNNQFFQQLLRRKYGEKFQKMSDSDVDHMIRTYMEGGVGHGYNPVESDANVDWKRSQTVYQNMVNENYDKQVENQLKDTESKIKERTSNIALNAQKIAESQASVQQKEQSLANEIKKVEAIIDLYSEIGKNYTAKTDLINLNRQHSKMLFPAQLYKEYLSAVDNTIDTIQGLIPSFKGLKGILDNVKNKNNKLKDSLESFDFSDLATDDDMKLFDDLLEAWK